MFFPGVPVCEGMEFVNCSQFVGQVGRAGLGIGRCLCVGNTHSWASLLPISDTGYFQTMTRLLATSAHSTHHGIHQNYDGYQSLLMANLT